jgi:hypothetical protein
LLPVDEATSCSDFGAFRQRLRDIIARKDSAALLAIVDPAIRISFGDNNGRDAFRREWVDGTAAGDVWRELGEVLRLGGRCRDGATFTAPYVFTDWPEDLDAFEHGAIIGTHVRLRSGPGLTAGVITLLDYAIVRVDSWGDDRDAWVAVTTLDGRKGLVSRRYIRSPIGLRASFTRADGSWRMTLFVQGD